MASSRLLIDSQHSGVRNMAVDEVLLESAIERQVAAIRVYSWSEPTVSLGHFQRADEAKSDPRLDGLATVRRLSGGGAILHHHEVTYSLAIPAAHALAANPSRLYRLAHAAIIDVLKESIAAASPAGRERNGTELGMRGDIRPSIDHRPSTIDPFLCFGRGDPNDIVLAGHKIVGSAQRRRRGAVLQHGSILLERSPHAPEFPGVRELAGVILPAKPLAQACGRRLADELCGSCDDAGLTTEELQRAETLAADKYAAINWMRPAR